MPRSNRPRRGRRSPAADLESESQLNRALYGSLRIEVKRGTAWNVQPVSASSAAKTYRCPGCGLEITPGQGHIVAWRADGLMGQEHDIAERRHWHSHCWKVN